MNAKHLAAITKLCRFCGEIISKKQRACPVTLHTELIKKTFLINIESDRPSIHPPNCCFRCLSTMRNIDTRATTTQLHIATWTEHEPKICKVCDKALKEHQGRKPKKIYSGRPAKTTAVWTRKRLTSIMNQIPVDAFPNDVELFNNENNPHLKFCCCYLCKRIISRPIMLMPCEHVFCVSCTHRHLDRTRTKNL